MGFVDGVRLHAIGGEQVLLCRVRYTPGKQVPWHKHDDAEQVMFILEGEVEMTIEDDTKTLVPGDVVVVNRGLHHKLYSESGVAFMEALSPVPLDHVPDKDLDLVLGPDGGAQHVAKLDAARPRRAVRAAADAGARVTPDRAPDRDAARDARGAGAEASTRG